MNVTIESPALRVLATRWLTDPLAAVGADKIQNNTKMITKNPAIFFTLSHPITCAGPRSDPSQNTCLLHTEPHRAILWLAANTWWRLQPRSRTCPHGDRRRRVSL